MKKTFKIAVVTLVVTAILSLSTISFLAIEIKRVFGDINNDAYVTTQDALLALSIATKIYDGEIIGMDFDATDIDKDNEITTLDARLILKLAAGQIFKEPMTGYEFDENEEMFLKELNQYRLEDNKKNHTLKLSKTLCSAAREAAKEYATKTGTALAREDGSYYFKLLDEKGIAYTVADKIIIPSTYEYTKTLKALTEDLQSKKALCSENFRKFGVGAYSKDGRTFYWCIFLTD